MTPEALSKLTPEEKRSRIAEILGWKYMRRTGTPSTWTQNVWLFSPSELPRSDGQCDWMGSIVGKFEECERPEKGFNGFGSKHPKWDEDLNAMHEAEKTLTVIQAWEYNRHLAAILGNAAGMGTGSVDEWDWHATAARRADAFILTIKA